MAKRGMSKTTKYVIGGGVALGVVGLIWYLAKPKTTAEKQQGGSDTQTLPSGPSNSVANAAPPPLGTQNAPHTKPGGIKPPPPLDPNSGNWA